MRARVLFRDEPDPIFSGPGRTGAGKKSGIPDHRLIPSSIGKENFQKWNSWQLLLKTRLRVAEPIVDV